MSVRTLPPNVTENLEGNIYMYIDNSILEVEGRRKYVERHSKMTSPDDPWWRYDIGILKNILANKWYAKSNNLTRL